MIRHGDGPVVEHSEGVIVWASICALVATLAFGIVIGWCARGGGL